MRGLEADVSEAVAPAVSIEHEIKTHGRTNRSPLKALKFCHQ